MIDLRRLVGSWNLVKHGRFDANGQYHSTGENMTGQLIYAQDGSMSVLIIKVKAPAQLSDIIAYSGTYSVEDDKVTHHVKVSPTPERMKRSGVRLASFVGEDLVLATEPDAEGRYEIIWRK